MIVVFDSGWTSLSTAGGHWLDRAIDNGVFFRVEKRGSKLREEVAQKWFYLLPDWSLDPEWGAFHVREEDNEILYIISRVSSPRLSPDNERRTVVIASSEAFWVKTSIEVRGPE